MSEQQDTAQEVTYTEAPASWNVKYYMNGFDCMLTLRASTGKELFEKVDAAMTWLDKKGARPKANGNGSPAPKAAPQASAPAHSGNGDAPTETHDVNTIAHAVTQSGHHYINVKCGPFSKFGIKAWEEVIPVDGWKEWEIGQEFEPPDGMKTAVISTGEKKKVVRFE